MRSDAHRTRAYCKRLLVLASGVALATFLATACGSSDLLVGDDSRDTPDGPGADTSPLSDAASSDADASKDASSDVATDAKGDVTCPELVQPPPGFCDGGPFAPTYNGDGCINGFACTPVLCTTAGGACVAVVPGACTSGHVGDASKYSCGSGIGVMCCLP